jgi:hypothetical protein
MKPSFFRPLAAFIAAAFLAFAAPASADTVTLKDGSVIHGKNLHIANGAVTITTTFSGDLTIKQELVASFVTDEPVYVKIKDAPAVLGKVEPKDAGLVIAGSGGIRPASVENIKSTWPASARDPDLAHWLFELSTDVSGKSGNTTGFAGNGRIVAVRKTATDALKLYGSADYTVANGLTSANNQKGGVEYNSFFSPAFSWFASGELMRDTVQEIDLRASTLAGIGWNSIRSPREDLQFRAGFSYRYETYDTKPNTPDFSSAGANLALVHRLNVSPWFVMHNSLSYMPSFKDTANFIIDHDSNVTMPLATSKAWSLRIGMTNEFTSKPVDANKRLDTTYYLRFIYTVR